MPAKKVQTSTHAADHAAVRVQPFAYASTWEMAALKASLPGSELNALARAAQRIAQAQDVAELFQGVVESADTLSNASACVLILHDEIERAWRVAATTHPKVHVGTRLVLPLPLPDVFDVEIYDPLARLWETPPWRLIVPLQAHNKIVGLLCAYAMPDERADFSLDERQRLGILADIAASAVVSPERAKQMARFQEVTHMRSRWRDLSAVLARAAEQTDAGDELLRYLHSLIPFTWGAIFQRVGAARLKLTHVKRGQEFTRLPDAPPLLLRDFPLLQTVVVERRIVRVEDARAETRWRPHTADYAANSWMGVPLRTDKVFGIISLGSQREHFFSDEHQTLLEILSMPIALALQNDLLWRSDKAMRARVSDLARRTINAQEEERKHVSRELHDQAGQSLTAIMINLELLQADLTGESQTLIDRTRESVRVAREAVQTIRGLVQQLRPPLLEMLGADAALQQLCQDYARWYRLDIQLRGASVGELSNPLALTLYRFIQEGLTNVARHAHAHHVTVELKREAQEIKVRLRDDGKGFNPEVALRKETRLGHLGLLGMQERLELVGGKMEIESAPGKGTLLCASLPLEAEPTARETLTPKKQKG